MTLTGMLTFCAVYALAVATPKSVRRLNRGSGLAMAGAAVVVATR